MGDENGMTGVKELRLGLVCYGGLSLAIYMHGITKEILKLVVASRALENDPAHNPFAVGTVEREYYEVLAAKMKRDDGILTRVVVDVIAGTSAGGINGIILAKALAHNLSQDALRQLWMEKADVKLLVGNKLQSAWKGLKMLGSALLPRLHVQPPIEGDRMFRWILAALEDMDQAPPAFDPGTSSGQAAPTTLMPEDHLLELFVTTTDYFGYRRSISMEDPSMVQERRHRHVFRFTHSGEEDSRFDAEHNLALTFAARATSSFPGAFPPIHLANINQNLKALQRPPIGFDSIKDELFRVYALDGENAEDTHFIDGGVLDNRPFGPAQEAIFKRPAEVEVSRRLIFIEPDPKREAAPAPDEVPTFGGAILAGKASIPGDEPILDDLLEVRRFNERVRRLNDLVERVAPRITDLVKAALPDVDLDAALQEVSADHLRQWSQRIHTAAETETGYTWELYFQFKVGAVVDQFAAAVCALCDFPEDSEQAFFASLVVREWALGQQLLGRDINRAEQGKFLQQFDMGFSRRRTRFVIQQVNDLYKNLTSGAHPTRQELDAAKKVLYDRNARLLALICGEGLSPLIKSQIVELFGRGFDLAKNLAEQAVAFVRDNADRLTAIADQLGNELEKERTEHGSELYDAFRALTANWDPEARKAVVVRYLGFPFWDALLYPIRRMSQVGELDELKVMRFSPEDSGALGKRGAKAKLMGIKLGHFGAFFDREGRENDYLWGRLDAAERLIHLLGEDAMQKPALLAILAEEERDGVLTTLGAKGLAERRQMVG